MISYFIQNFLIKQNVNKSNLFLLDSFNYILFEQS